ncbi:MAG: GrpB family protein [Candidatus Pacebacteria bacterium]|nr:GrpB family protein [Candidatus Paceibacterota bacterium]
MLTSSQEKWINHLSDVDRINIVPFDFSANEKFEKIREKVKNILGDKIIVEHCGATSLGISGQDEIDVYIPTSPINFDLFANKLKTIFGNPRSIYPLERIRFTTKEEEKRVDIFLINKESDSWKNGVKFENYLKLHLDDLKKYEKLKEDGNGLSVREYYRKKTEFINDILLKEIDGSSGNLQ